MDAGCPVQLCLAVVVASKLPAVQTLPLNITAPAPAAVHSRYAGIFSFSILDLLLH